jgi:hypothetical protein
MSDAASIGSRQYLTTRAIFSDRNADGPPRHVGTLLPSDGPVRFSGAPAALDDEILEQHHCPARHFPKFGADTYRRHGWDLGLARDRRPNRSIMGLDGPELGSMKMREEIDACRIVNARMFRATAHAEVTDAPGAGAVRDEAFGKAATKLVIWTSEVI